jgi:integrase
MSSSVVPFPSPTPAKPSRVPRRRILAAQTIRGLKVPDKGMVEYFDDHTPGLSLRVTSADVRSWSFLYRNKQGRQRRLTLGRYPAIDLATARDLVRDARNLLAAGKDPAEEKQAAKSALTFGDLVQRWIDLKVKPSYRNGGKEELRMLEADVLPKWRHRIADEITRKEAFELLDAKLEKGFKVARNRMRSLILRIYNWGVERELVTTNPIVGIRMEKERGRQRVLTEDEIRRVWKAAETQPLRVCVWFKLRLVTAQRGGELLKMRWQDINPETHCWTIPNAVAKNGQDHPIYLSELSRELLATIPRNEHADHGGFVFPAGDANGAKIDLMGDYKKVARRIAQPSRANIVRPTPGRKPGRRHKADFTGHDLRRTATTFMAQGGVPHDLAKKVLNHASEEKDDVTAIYNRYQYMPEKKAIMEFWGKQLRAILAGEPVANAGRYRLEMESPA